MCGGVKTSKIVHSMGDRFKQAGIEFIGANNITTIIDLLNRGDYYDRAVFFEKGITDDGSIIDEHKIRNRLYEFMETVIPKAQVDSSYVFVVDKEDIAKMISDETMSISYQSKIFVKSGSLAMKYLAMIMASPLSEMDTTYEFDLSRYNESMRSSESVEYSDVAYSDGEQLSSISNYEFDGVIADGESSADESVDISYIGDFDDVDALEDRGLGDYGKSVKFIGVESRDTEDGDIRHRRFIGKGLMGKQKSGGIQSDRLEYNTDSGNRMDSAQGNIEVDDGSDYSFDYEDTEDRHMGHGGMEFTDEKDLNSGDDIGFEYVEDCDTIELDADDIVDVDDSIDLIDIKNSGIDNEDIDKTANTGLGNAVEFDLDDIDSGVEDDLDTDDLDTDDLGTDDLGTDGLDDFDSLGDRDDYNECFDSTDDLADVEEDNDTDLTVDIFTEVGSSRVSDDEDDKYSYNGVENEVDIADLWGESTDTSKCDKDETDLWQEGTDKLSLFSEGSRANRVTPSIGLNQAISQSQESSRSIDVIGQCNDVDNTGSDGSKSSDKGKQKKGILGGLRGLTARSKSGNKVSKGTDKIAMDSRLESILNTYKSRGCSMVVTGTSCSGKSVIAYNLANLLRELGYSVLIVDMDTIGRAQAYISKYSYDCMHSMDAENSSLKQALNAINHGAGEYVNIIKPNLHLLSLGLAGDIVTGDKLAPKTRVARFCSNIRNNYNFIIYDMPFKSAIDYASDITFTADNILFTCECNTHGFMNMMLDMCNIDSEDMQETMFCRSQLCFTKYKDFNNVFGDRVKGAKEALTRVDLEVQGLLGIEPEYYFSNLSVCGIIPYDESYDGYWFKEKQITDTPSGKSDYLQLLSNLLIKK